MTGREAVKAILQPEDDGLLGAAQALRSVHNALQDRLQLKFRSADDTEDFRGRSLSFKQFAQFRQQPRILDGDHRLVGKIRHQFDLLVGERADFLPIEGTSPTTSSSLSIGTVHIERMPA